jgi:hypothetical protein
MLPLAAGAGGLLAAGEEVMAAFPEALIEGFEHVVPLLENSEKDQHVLAVIQGGIETRAFHRRYNNEYYCTPSVPLINPSTNA